MKKLYRFVHNVVVNCILYLIVKWNPTLFTKIFHEGIAKCKHQLDFLDMLEFCDRWQKHVFLNRGLVESAWDKMALERLNNCKPDKLHTMSRIVRPNSPVVQNWIEKSLKYLEAKPKPDPTDADETATLLQFAEGSKNSMLINRVIRLSETIHRKTGRLVIKEGGSTIILEADGNFVIMST